VLLLSNKNYVLRLFIIYEITISLFTIKDTLFIGKSFIDLAIIDSTNNYAQQLLANSQPADGTLISTFNQNKGKGYHNNTWLSEANKNLSFSIILYPNFIDAHQQFYLNMAISIAIVEALNDYSKKEFLIKWPNDIYFNKKKIGGILIENSIIGSKINTCIIGVGLNINQKNFNAALPNPSSLKLITNKTTDLYKLLNELVKSIESKYQILQSGAFEQLAQQYKNQLYGINKLLKFKIDGNLFEGIIKGVDDFGRLVISENSIEKKYHYKEIEYVF